MADLGHQLTEKELKALESRIAAEYKQAEIEVEKKLRNYLQATEAGRLQQEQLLAAGKITQKEYSDWCYRHAMVGKRWEEMKDVLAADYHHASEIALGITKNEMPNIYALNANYATYQIEHDGLIDTGFTLYDHDTANYLLGDQRQLMPGPSAKKAREIAANKDMQWNKQHIQSAVLQGVLQGESPYKVAERLRSVAQMDYNASVRYARTMTTSAQNAGRYESFHRSKKLGVDLTIEWQATLDQRTRQDHRLMHGQRTEVDEPFHTPDGYTIYYPADCTGNSDAPQKEIWNCRCTLLAWVKGFEGDTVKDSPKMGDMSFEEWQQSKPMGKEEQDAWIKAGKPNAKDWENNPARKLVINANNDNEQFERYKNVLGDIAPRTVDSFTDLKYNNPEEWKVLKQQYRTVNQYKTDSGSMSPQEILDMDRRVITEKRTQFTSNYKRSGNIAGAYIDGDKDNMVFAHSRLSESSKGYKGTSELALLKTERRFQYIDVTRPDGTIRPDTFNDTEAKLFEYFADRYDNKPFSSITMLSERGMCDSCRGVMEQFHKLHPDVKITVVSNKKIEGDVWKHRWRNKK